MVAILYEVPPAVRNRPGRGGLSRMHVLAEAEATGQLHPVEPRGLDSAVIGLASRSQDGERLAVFTVGSITLMLMLSRKVGESVVIPLAEGEIVVTVVEIRGTKVRLGIEGPPEIPVHRREVLASIRAGGNGRLHVEPGHRVRSRVA